MEAGIHPSLQENCHHQIIYSKFDLKIFYPPMYKRITWHYKYTNNELMKRFVENFDWYKSRWIKIVPSIKATLYKSCW